jgi:DNA-binding transcriptional LysR family regulator
MHWKPELIESRPEPATTGLDLRHFGAFQQVYRLRDFTEAGHALNTTRKSIRRMMDNLEKAFQCPLFTESGRDQLVPSPFADRLFNDLRFLNTAQQLLEERIRATHEAGRVLHIGTSPSVFRTSAFRSLFRDLQSLKGVRPTYVPVAPDDGCKALSNGTCDIHFGTKKCVEKRFLTEVMMPLEFFPIMRADHATGSVTPPPSAIPPYALTVDGGAIDFSGGNHRVFQSLAETTWLGWLEHPAQCPAGTVIFVPDLPSDTTRWARVDTTVLPPFQKSLYLTYLKQHPYEFLSSVRSVIQSRNAGK